VQTSDCISLRPAQSKNVKTQENLSEFFDCFDLFVRKGRGSSASAEKEGA